MATIQEIDAQIAYWQREDKHNPTKLRDLQNQRKALTASDAEIQAQIDSWNESESKSARRWAAPYVAEQKRRAATATLATPSSTPAQKWAARQVTSPVITAQEADPGDVSGSAARRIAEQNKSKAVISDEQAALANAHAAQNTPQWQAVVNAYNTGQEVPAEFVPLLNNLNAYFQQGQAAPGTLTPTLAGEALRQWGIDAQPGGFDKFMGIAAPIALGLLTGGVGGIGAIGGLTGAGAAAAGGAVAGATSAGMRGGDFGDILKGGVTGGALAYGGGLLGEASGLGGTGTSETILANAGYTNAQIATIAANTTPEVMATLASNVTPMTGGAFVGTNGVSMITGSGNAVVDGALNSAMSSVTKNAAVNVLTGNDPLANAGNAALGGAAFGGVSAAIPDNMNITGNALIDQSLSGAANSALPAGAAALATGGDVGNALIGGGLIGAGTPLVNAGVDLVAPQDEVPRINSMLNSTAQGSLVGGVSAGVGGGDIVNGMVVGGLGGLGGNLAGQAVDYLSDGSMGQGTIGNTLAQTAGTVAGQVIGNDLAPTGVTIPAASPVYTNFVQPYQPGTMTGVDSMLNPNYTGGLLNNYQSLAVQRAN